MANYRQIHTQIWRDNWFLDLEPDEKLLFIYLFSNDNSNLAGLYELHERIIQLETGLDRKRINEERWHVANELLSRENELRKRRLAIERAHLPAKLELDKQVPQMGLF